MVQWYDRQVCRLGEELMMEWRTYTLHTNKLAEPTLGPLWGGGEGDHTSTTIGRNVEKERWRVAFVVSILKQSLSLQPKMGPLLAKHLMHHSFTSIRTIKNPLQVRLSFSCQWTCCQQWQRKTVELRGPEAWRCAAPLQSWPRTVGNQINFIHAEAWRIFHAWFSHIKKPFCSIPVHSFSF